MTKPITTHCTDTKPITTHCTDDQTNDSSLHRWPSQSQLIA